MQSSEFSAYQWVPARSWTSGRKPGQPSVIFIHTTEGSEGTHSAEDGAAYDARRTDGVSTHFFVDQDTTVQCVKTGNEAHHARTHGNDVGIAIETCGRAGQTDAQWEDAASAGAIEQTAQLAVALREQYGKDRFPLVNLTPSGLRAGGRGFAEHKDATLAWPEDGGDHTDPGPNYPWTKLFTRIKELEGTTVATADEIAKDVWGEDIDRSTTGAYTAGGALWVLFNRSGALVGPNSIPNEINELQDKVNDMVADDKLEFDALSGAIVVLNAKLDALLARTPVPPTSGAPEA